MEKQEANQVAHRICTKLNGPRQTPSAVTLYRSGKFAVIRCSFETNERDVRVLLFSPDGEDYYLVQLNVCLQPLSGSVRRIVFTASYEELRDVYAGTGVVALPEAVVGDFFRAYDRLDRDLQDRLDGVDVLPTPPGRRRRAA